MIGLLVLVLLVGFVLGLAFWGIDLMPMIPAPFKNLAKVICIIIAIILIVGSVWPYTGVHLGTGCV